VKTLLFASGILRFVLLSCPSELKHFADDIRLCSRYTSIEQHQCEATIQFNWVLQTSLLQRSYFPLRWTKSMQEKKSRTLSNMYLLHAAAAYCIVSFKDIWIWKFIVDIFYITNWHFLNSFCGLKTGTVLIESDKESGHQKTISSLCMSADKSHFLTSSADKSAKVRIFSAGD
jgi:hypothetical protein